MIREFFSPIVEAVVAALLYLSPFLFYFGVIPALLYVTNYCLTLPMRRQERARFFLDLLETGLHDGHSPEHTITNLSKSRDRTLPVRFHLLAAHIENGMSFAQAMEEVPRLLPPQIIATLQAGAELGDLTKVLPACRQQLRDGSSQTRGAMNYLFVFGLISTPLTLFLWWTLGESILPGYYYLMRELLEVKAVPDLVIFNPWLKAVVFPIQILVPLIFLFLAVCYLGGPRLRGWVSPFSDWLAMRSPWRRKRLHRDCSSMLALLLDAGLPEKRALQLAAASTANRSFIRRAERAVAEMSQGAKLTDAVARLDDSGEFRWRLANASQASRGFTPALAGWIEALDAKAFQQEQAAAQVLTTTIVLLNGVMVGLIAVGIFQVLTLLIEEGVLW